MNNSINSTNSTTDDLLAVNSYQPDGLTDAIISQLYQFSILTEEDWMRFKRLFNRLHPGFISRLRQQFPLQTDGGQRQTLLIKLSVSTRESAHMLGISVESIIKCRYRLKKKLNLPEAVNLDDFVKRF